MQSNNFLSQTIDNLIQETYLSTEPGAAVIVVREGEVVLRKGQGLANLELGVPIEPDMVFRIGSITKQFTAVAILMLAEQGKLTLDDSISRFLPDYPTHDYLITVRHLLTHTSGIKSYTAMPEWPPVWRKDFTVQELIDFFKYQPMVSAPGKRWAYNNSGYILLGAIIEKVSGQSYEQFIQQNIFDPLGMRQSYYDDPARIIQRRVAGYEMSSDGFVNAAYLSMTQPYAAGALASTVDDLALWDSALYTERLLKHETLKQAHIPQSLMDGSSTGYGYGWIVSEYAGHQFVEHGGGIHGFRARLIRIPDSRVFVAVLSNNGGVSPELLAFKIAALAIDQPYSDPKPFELQPEVLTLYEGVYEGSATKEIHITCEENRLFFQYGENSREELIPLSQNEFFFKDMSLDRLRFVSDTNEVVNAMEIRSRTGIPDLARKINKSVPLGSMDDNIA
jgi:CubicO group peptidase (beta-lactamase class C family)